MYTLAVLVVLNVNHIEKYLTRIPCLARQPCDVNDSCGAGQLDPSTNHEQAL